MPRKDTCFWVELVCDHCSLVGYGLWVDYATAKQQMRAAEKLLLDAKWSYDPRNQHLCPDCQARDGGE